MRFISLIICNIEFSKFPQVKDQHCVAILWMTKKYTINGIQCEILNSLHGFVFLKQSYFVLDVIMVNQNAKKIIAFSSS